MSSARIGCNHAQDLPWLHGLERVLCADDRQRTKQTGCVDFLVGLCVAIGWVVCHAGCLISNMPALENVIAG